MFQPGYQSQAGGPIARSDLRIFVLSLFLKILFIIWIMGMYPVWAYVHKTSGARGGQKLELQVAMRQSPYLGDLGVGSQTWVLCKNRIQF